MKQTFAQEIIVSLIFVILIVFLLNPFHAWMSPSVLMAGNAILFIVFVLFAGLIWREKGRDERETVHIMRAGRFAFISGVAILTIGIIVTSIQHQPNMWIALSLGIMILAKITGLVYSKLYN